MSITGGHYIGCQGFLDISPVLHQLSQVTQDLVGVLGGHSGAVQGSAQVAGDGGFKSVIRKLSQRKFQ